MVNNCQIPQQNSPSLCIISRSLFIISCSLTIVGAGLKGHRVHTPVCSIIPDAFEGDTSGGVIEVNIDGLFFLDISGENGLDE